MINKGWKFLRSVAAAGALSALGCGIISVDNGGSTGTEVSALSGTVIDRNGNPVNHALVRLRPRHFLSDSARSEAYIASHTISDTITGSDGKFSFNEILPDSYTVEVASGDTLGSYRELYIGAAQPVVALPPLITVPPAEITGKAQVAYGSAIPVFIQVYGLERSVRVDPYQGLFSVKVPCEVTGSRHRLHIGAYIVDTTADTKIEFDGWDVELEVVPGEQLYAGTFNLRLPPPPPCPDGLCDSAVVRYLLASTGNGWVTLESVTRTENGRIVELNLRGKNLSQGIPFDINRLVALQVLDLGETGLPFMFPNLGRMVKLEIVRLDGNKLQLFSQTVGDLVNLRELDLSGNELTSLPPSILNCTNITMLNVSNNRLCAVDFSMAAWIDRFDPDWRWDQRCFFSQVDRSNREPFR